MFGKLVKTEVVHFADVLLSYVSLLILEQAQSMFVVHSALLHCDAWVSLDTRSTEVFFGG